MPCKRLHPVMPLKDASTQTSDQPVSSLSFDVAVQTSFHSVHTSSLDAARQKLHAVLPLRTFPHRWVLAKLPRVLLTCLSRLPYAVGCIFLNGLVDRQRSSSAQGDIDSVSLPPFPDIATTCTLSSSSHDFGPTCLAVASVGSPTVYTASRSRY